MQPEEITNRLKESFADAEIYVDGDGRHFQVIVVSDIFTDKSMVQQHQLIYKVLGDKVGGDIHALSINTYTQHQWQKQQQIMPTSID